MEKIKEFANKLGEGKIEKLREGTYIFRLSSFEDNPIIKPQDFGLLWQENGKEKLGAIFNGGAEIFENKVIVAPRCHKNYRRIKFFDPKMGMERYGMENYIAEVCLLQSKNGHEFEKRDEIVIKGDGSEHKDFEYGIEDLRIVKFGDFYILVGCGKTKPPFKGSNADRIAIYSTKDFRKIDYHGIVKWFDSRNAVPFPEEINGKLYMLFRFHPNIHLDYLEGGIEQLLEPLKFEREWLAIYERRNSNLLLKAGDFIHEKEKIGPGPQLIKTEKGWLLIYHAVGEIPEEITEFYGLKSKIERGYSVSVALLDLENPAKVIRRSKFPIYIPNKSFELYGDARYPVDVPAVVFPTGAIVVEDKLLIYAGTGDKYISLYSASLKKLLDYLLSYG